MGPEKLKSELVELPVNELGEYNLKYQITNTIGKFVSDARYLLIDESGTVTSGITDQNGFTDVIYTDNSINFSIHVILNEGDEND